MAETTAKNAMETLKAVSDELEKMESGYRGIKKRAARRRRLLEHALAPCRSSAGMSAGRPHSLRQTLPPPYLLPTGATRKIRALNPKNEARKVEIELQRLKESTKHAPPTVGMGGSSIGSVGLSSGGYGGGSSSYGGGTSYGTNVQRSSCAHWQHMGCLLDTLEKTCEEDTGGVADKMEVATARAVGLGCDSFAARDLFKGVDLGVQRGGFWREVDESSMLLLRLACAH